MVALTAEIDIALPQDPVKRQLAIETLHPECPNQCFKTMGGGPLREIKTFNQILEGIRDLTPQARAVLMQMKSGILEEIEGICQNCPVHKSIVTEQEKITEEQKQREAVRWHCVQMATNLWHSSSTQEGLSTVYESTNPKVPYRIRIDPETHGDGIYIHAQIQGYGPRLTVDSNIFAVYIHRHSNEDPEVLLGLPERIKRAIALFILGQFFKLQNHNPTVKSQPSEGAVVFYKITYAKD